MSFNETSPDVSVNIAVKYEGTTQKFKIKPTQKMLKLMQTYCELHRLDFHSVRFLTDEGVRVQGGHTITELGLTEGSILDVLQRQDGGRA